MGIKIVHHQCNPIDGGVKLIDQLFHLLSEVTFGSLRRDGNMPLPGQRFVEHEQIRRAVADILVVATLRLTGGGGDHWRDFPHQLLALFIKTDYCFVIPIN